MFKTLRKVSETMILTEISTKVLRKLFMNFTTMNITTEFLFSKMED